MVQGLGFRVRGNRYSHCRYKYSFMGFPNYLHSSVCPWTLMSWAGVGFRFKG